MKIRNSTPTGLQKSQSSAISPGLKNLCVGHRGYRYAQPPAKICDPFGVIISRSQGLSMNKAPTIDPHPLLDLQIFLSTLPKTLGELPSSPGLNAMLSLNFPAPLHSDD